jgi:hypothetical protein
MEDMRYPKTIPWLSTYRKTCTSIKIMTPKQVIYWPNFDTRRRRRRRWIYSQLSAAGCRYHNFLTCSSQTLFVCLNIFSSVSVTVSYLVTYFYYFARSFSFTIYNDIIRYWWSQKVQKNSSVDFKVWTDTCYNTDSTHLMHDAQLLWSSFSE